MNTTVAYKPSGSQIHISLLKHSLESIGRDSTQYLGTPQAIHIKS